MSVANGITPSYACRPTLPSDWRRGGGCRRGHFGHYASVLPFVCGIPVCAQPISVTNNSAPSRRFHYLLGLIFY